MGDLPRSSGVQLHLTSLPSGTLGRDAYRFVDWLAYAGQTWWQVLPLGPPDDDRSPYRSASAFAAWKGLLAAPRALQRRGYRWWVERVRRTLELFDMARIDHFRGLVSHWAAPEGAHTAAGGHWRRGPGTALFRALQAELATTPARRRAAAHTGWTGPLDIPLVAEDLGVITPPAQALRRRLGLPGMLVIQFGWIPPIPPAPTGWRTTPATGSSTPPPTIRTRCTAGGTRWAPKRGRSSPARSPATDSPSPAHPTGTDPLRVLLGRRGGDARGPRTCADWGARRG